MNINKAFSNGKLPFEIIAELYPGQFEWIPEDTSDLDLLYITNQSITLDLKILFYTVKIVFVPESTEGVAENQKTAYRE